MTPNLLYAAFSNGYIVRTPKLIQAQYGSSCFFKYKFNNFFRLYCNITEITKNDHILYYCKRKKNHN